MTIDGEYENCDATELARLVRNEGVTPEQLLDLAIRRVDKLNPTLNAVVQPMYDEARRDIERGLPDGPFRGVPFMLKDLAMLYEGVPTTNGSALFKDFAPDHHSFLVERYCRAGMVIMGKTNTPELGLSATTEPTLHGATLNPWDTNRSPGGSSGGAAAIVAARILPAAHATDGGGSIRIPATCCGLFGLKPTRARTPVGPDLGEGWSGMGIGHAVTRSVRDSAALLDATHGPTDGDPYCAPPPPRSYAEEASTEPGRLRIAVSTAAPNDVPVHGDCVAATEDAAKLCREVGHEVEEAAPRFDMNLLIQAMRIIWGANTRAAVELRYHGLGKTPDGEGLETVTWNLAREGKTNSAADYARAIQVLHRTGRDFADFLSKYDLFLTPTVAQPPWPLKALNMMDDDLDAYLYNLFAHIPFTPQFNATGQPAMSVPLYWNDDDLPIGVQFAGRFGDEATLFRLAGQLEQARPWAHRRPQIIT
jgi:amidase